MATLDNIEYNGQPYDSNWLVYKYPTEQYTTGTRLIVSHGQEALVFNGSDTLGVFGPGIHTLGTITTPTVQGQFASSLSPKTQPSAIVYYVNKTAKLNLLWGTPTAIPLEDPKYGLILKIGAYGQYGITIKDARLFVSRIIGAIPSGATIDHIVILEYFNGLISTKIKSIISEYMIKKQISFLEISLYLAELSETFREVINAEFEKFGVEVVGFFCESIAPHPEDYEKLCRHKERILANNAAASRTPLQSEDDHMPSPTTVYDLLISCPSDVAPFLGVIQGAVRRFNANYGRFANIMIRENYWSKDAYPTNRERPQALINRQIVDPANMAIGIFWTRFGQPTGLYDSGTEEEIERLLQQGKQVFLYFLEKPVPPNQIDSAQYKKIQEFKERHKRDSIYWLVNDEDDLANCFYDHLVRYFGDLHKRELIRTARRYGKPLATLQILWVDDHPENNNTGRELLKQYGIETILAISTEQALAILATNHSISLVISDMERKEGSREGYVLLNSVRNINPYIPFYFFTSSKKPEHLEEALRRGAQGCTNRFDELADMVIKSLLKGNSY